jgi:hypothetical protein
MRQICRHGSGAVEVTSDGSMDMELPVLLGVK